MPLLAKLWEKTTFCSVSLASVPECVILETNTDAASLLGKGCAHLVTSWLQQTIKVEGFSLQECLRIFTVICPLSRLSFRRV